MYVNIPRTILTLGIALYSCSSVHPNSIQKPVITTGESVVGTNDAEESYRKCRELFEKGLYRPARESFLKMFERMKSNGQQKRAVEMLAEMAEDHLGVGKYEEANTYYQRLLQIEALPRSTHLNALISMGTLYQRLQHFALAITYYEKSLELSKRYADRQAQSRTLFNMASVLVAMNEIEQAAACLDRVRGLGVNDPALEANLLWLTGRIQLARTNTEAARQAFESARIRVDAIPDADVNHVLLLADLSNLYLDRKQKDAAYAIAKEAWSKAQRLKHDEALLRARLAMARVQRTLGLDKEAYDSYLFAISRVEKLLIYVSPDSLKIGVLEQGQAPYREFVDFLMRTNREEDALNIVEHARARAALSLISRPLKASLEQKEALQRMARKVARVKTEILSSPNGGSRSALEKQLKDAELENEELRVQIDLSRQREFVQPVNPAIERTRFLRTDQALISFFLTRDRSYAWFMTHDRVRSVALPGQDEVESKVREYIKAIRTQPSSLTFRRDVEQQRHLGRELYSLLLAGFADQIKPGQALVIVPDGLLSYLPFETLVDNDRYLVEEHDIGYVPSVTVLALLNEREKNRRSTDRLDLLAFGAPATEFRKNTPKELLPLPGAVSEIRAISDNFTPDRRRVYTGRNATEEAFKQEDLSRYRYIHLATHGFVDIDSPGRSGIVLAIDSDPLEDGILHLNEIADLDLRCDLIVLSACRTARGQLMRGEGVVGLTRGFLSAGAAAAAVSLWDVSDISTNHFMRRFYKRLVSGTVPVVALRQAKLEFIKGNGIERHPYHWAPFILVGSVN